jgi:hypothetical protein
MSRDYKLVTLFPPENNRHFPSTGKMPVCWIAYVSDDGQNTAGNPPRREANTGDGFRID